MRLFPTAKDLEAIRDTEIERLTAMLRRLPIADICELADALESGARHGAIGYETWTEAWIATEAWMAWIATEAWIA